MIKKLLIVLILSTVGATADLVCQSFYIYDVRSVQIPRVEISRYDDIMRRVAMREPMDWRLLLAIAHHESGFRPDAVSSKGARGIMQVRPIVARHFNIPVALINDVETNVMLAAKLLRSNEKDMNIAAGTPLYDRLALVLACYNAGDRHVTTARRAARLHGLDPNSWVDVSRFLNRPQTTAFVRNVMEQYAEYCMIVPIA